MVDEITWLDCVQACDELLETLKLKMLEEPASGKFWQERIEATMANRQGFLELAQIEEEQQFKQSLSVICERVLEKSKEQE